MKLKFTELFVAEGDPADLSLFALLILECLKAKYEKEERETVIRDSGLEELIKNMTFNELRKRERWENYKRNEDDKEDME